MDIKEFGKSFQKWDLPSAGCYSLIWTVLPTKKKPRIELWVETGREKLKLGSTTNLLIDLVQEYMPKMFLRKQKRIFHA